ncbi:hypothetical protein BCR34DRAFT_601327 [Clohesyomyces aquaticus]|uniref:Ricin B lectin domain-containing protein n=1 Tax=Clohesyomyces aquaticus TaxID=1231657 RepID=A0A1Y1ZNG0_9PLEO|nr:hypothetical protein BCR34DRAFT_601327 [Clohesyomyces aquaticus]
MYSSTGLVAFFFTGAHALIAPGYTGHPASGFTTIPLPTEHPSYSYGSGVHGIPTGILDNCPPGVSVSCSDLAAPTGTQKWYSGAKRRPDCYKAIEGYHMNSKPIGSRHLACFTNGGDEGDGASQTWSLSGSWSLPPGNPESVSVPPMTPYETVTITPDGGEGYQTGASETETPATQMPETGASVAEAPSFTYNPGPSTFPIKPFSEIPPGAQPTMVDSVVLTAVLGQPTSVAPGVFPSSAMYGTGTAIGTGTGVYATPTESALMSALESATESATSPIVPSFGTYPSIATPIPSPGDSNNYRS